MAARDPRTTQLPQLLLLATVTLLTAVWGVASLARQVSDLGPRVGDIVAFDPAHPSPFESNARLNANRTGLPSCVLDVTVLQRSGGSFVVEQRGSSPERIYTLHWAGSRTSRDAEDCGTAADLVVSQTDMSALAMAASGPAADATTALRLR